GDSGYQAQFNIANLSNSANGSTANDVLTLESQSKTTYRTVFNVQGGNYEGTIKLLLNQSGDNRKVALNLSNEAAAKAVIQLEKGSNTTGTNPTLALGLATDKVSVRGITGSVGGIYSGAQAFGNVGTFAGDGTTRTLQINTAGSNYSTAAALGDHINLHKEGAGSQTFSGTVADSIAKVQVDAGELAFTNRAALSIEQLTLLGEATLSVSQSDTKSTITITDAVTLTGGATLNAGLDLSGANTLTLNANADTTVTISGSLVLSDSSTVSLAGTVLTQLSSLEEGDTLDLFTGISSLTLSGNTYTTDLTATDNVLLENYFTGLNGGSYALGYTAATGTLYAQCLSVPEPATATLSLLALSALAARRRRRR
ncbi:MAG: PEP-CTERM sorting domain-containing protein, partial [Akkermansia sp.]